MPSACFTWLALATLASACASTADGASVLELGRACDDGRDCAGGYCVAVRPDLAVCSRPCESAGDCPSAVNWSCERSANIASSVCRCQLPIAASGARYDLDCNGVADENEAPDASSHAPDGEGREDGGAALDASMTSDACVGDACHAPVCAPNELLCGGGCVNASSESHCGACDRTCSANEVCASATCSCPDVVDCAGACGGDALVAGCGWCVKSTSTPCTGSTKVVPELTRSGYGAAVTLDGDMLAVGAPFDRYTDSIYLGSVTLYERVNGSFVWQDVLGPSEKGNFGSALAFVGGVLAVGAPYAYPDTPQRGDVVIYDVAGGKLVELERLRVKTSATEDAFGKKIAASGRRLAVLAEGALYFFIRGDAGFEFEQRLAIQGSTVVLSGNWAVVPAYHEGGLRILQRTDTGWELGPLLALDGNPVVEELAASGNWLAVGLPGKVGMYTRLSSGDFVEQPAIALANVSYSPTAIATNGVDSVIAVQDRGLLSVHAPAPHGWARRANFELEWGFDGSTQYRTDIAIAGRSLAVGVSQALYTYEVPAW